VLTILNPKSLSSETQSGPNNYFTNLLVIFLPKKDRIIT
jgi:hypothetical protein